MAVSTLRKRRLLAQAATNAPAYGRTLREHLEVLEAAKLALVDSGQIASVSANGRATAYSTHGTQPDDIADAYGQLIELYDRAATALGSADEAAILAEMDAQLDTPATEAVADYSLARA